MKRDTRIATERGHLIGDVPALLLIAIILGALMQMGSAGRATSAVAAE